MRAPRYRQPDQYLDTTVRCHHSEMRLLPKAERVNILGFCLAKAQAQYQGIEIVALCQMSNHLHLTLRDRFGEASSFMGHFLSNVAKAINALDHRHGAVSERRFSEIPIVDQESISHRVAYVVCNPVAAKLVRSHREWKGLCGMAGAEQREKSFTKFSEARYDAAVQTAIRVHGPAPKREGFVETATLKLAAVRPDIARAMVAAVEELEAELQGANHNVLGMKRVGAVAVRSSDALEAEPQTGVLRVDE